MPKNLFNALIALMLFFSGCDVREESESINLSQNNQISLFDIFSKVRVIQLETKTESLMSGIGKADFYNDYYFIVDGRGREFFCFDKNGKFVFKISAFGKGPGEYSFIGDFTIDKFNEQIIILDPPSYKVLFFDLNGKFIEEKSVATADIMGYFRVFSLNDSVLLLTSMNNYQLVFYSRKEENVIHKGFPIPHDMGFFAPYAYVYQSECFTYALPVLKQNVMNISGITPEKHFTWCFGKSNNTENQINTLRNKLKTNAFNIQEMDIHEAVSEKELLNHYIYWLFEANRYSIALVEFENNFKHVVIDKKQNKTFVFDYFKEGVSIALSNFSANEVITYEHRVQSIYKEMGRELLYFSKDHLSEECQHIIDNHNIEIDNPFLVVYTFKD